MRRERRLRDNEDYRRVRRTGRSWAHPLLVLFVADQPTDGPDPKVPRIGITVSKRVGGAVTRNRVKRRVREIVRKRFEDLCPGLDLVFLARSDAAEAPYPELEGAVDALLERSGVARVESHGPGA